MSISYKGARVGSVYTSILDPIVTQEPGNSSVHVMSQKAATASFANALKGRALGQVVALDAVAPVPVKATVRSKNFCPIAERIVSGTGSWTSATVATIPVESEKVYTISADFTQTGADIATVQLAIRRGADINGHVAATQSTKQSGKLWVSFTVPADETGVQVVLYSNLSADALNTSCTFSHIQIEEGTTATTYTPVIADGTVVNVSSGSRNVLNLEKFIKSSAETSLKADVVTTAFTSSTLFVNKDRSYLLPKGEYTVVVEPKSAPISVALYVYTKTEIDKGTYQPYVAKYITQSTTYRTKITVDEPFAFSVGGYTPYGTYSFKVAVIPEGMGETYEPFIEGQTVTTEVGASIELEPIAPAMAVTLDEVGAQLLVEYSKDTNLVIEKIAQDCANGGNTSGGAGSGEGSGGGTSVTIGGQAQAVFPADTYIAERIAALVNSAPATLDTLAEIATALGNDPNFATTILAELGQCVKKLPKVSTTMIIAQKANGEIFGYPISENKTAYTIMYRGANGVTNVGTPTDGTHATTKDYVDGLVGDISAALDEVHAYAQALANGGAD